VSNIRAAEESGALVYAVQYNTLEDAKRQLRGGVKQVYTDGPLSFDARAE
jgi:glycerophosphoryl diester phosphodiesterase